MKKSIRVIIAFVALASLLAACVPAAQQAAAPQVQNTQSLMDTQSEINTAVAQTIEAQNQVGTFVAQTMEAQATPTFTVTPFSIPTFTPFAVIPTATSVSSYKPPVKPDYQCDIISRRPRDNMEIGHGQKFDIKWTIVNTGAKTWPAGYDVKYFSGPHMATVDIVQIPVEMKPRDQYLIVMDAFAPQERGRQVMTWTVQGQICYPYVALNVK
ncbi:MAG: NBR1-Ig-like domain-containing protein [Anaerolineales bacterium]|nr:NBR1-Ig-like domain-containing protein [Anaerolineales bacterium]